MKKKGFLGKLLGLAAAVAAIAGVCYIFRDKIKESSIYKLIMEKLGGDNDKYDDLDDFEEDFFFDDEDDDEVENNREYTSIVSAPKNNDEEEPEDKADDTDSNDEIKVTNIFGDSTSTINVEDTPIAYENEGLSDDEDDPDTLEEQDKLDF